MKETIVNGVKIRYSEEARQDIKKLHGIVILDEAAKLIDNHKKTTKTSDEIDDQTRGFPPWGYR